MKAFRALLILGLVPWVLQCAPDAPKPKSAVQTGSSTGAGAGAGKGTTTGSGNGTAAGGGTAGGGMGTPVDTTVPAGPTTPAIAVANGTATFDLAAAKSTLPGASLSAALSVSPAAGTVPASISLSGFAIKAPASTGFVLYRPVLVKVGADGKETQFPIGTNISMKIPKGRTVPLANLLTVPFEGVQASDKIKLRFSALEPLEPALLDGLTNYRECKAPQSFTAVGQSLQSCKGCHSGLFAYDFMDKDNATACGQNLKMIDKTLNPTGKTPAIPTGTHHGANAGSVSTAVGTWRTGEGL